MTAPTTTRTRLNGVDVPALVETIEAMKADPSLGRSQWRNRNRWYDGGLNRSEIQDFYAAGREDDSRKVAFVFDNDEPPVLLGQNRGPNPVEYILHALAGCITTTMVYYAAAMGIELSRVETEFEGDIDLRGLLGVSSEVDPGYEQIRVKVHVEGDGTPDQLDELVDIAKAHSPVYDSLTRPVEIQVERVA
jgi:uncharacterized OsmC-like protein